MVARDQQEVLVPLLSLRMKGSPLGNLSELDYEDAVESLSVMVEQEKLYRCRDYLSRLSRHEHKSDDACDNESYISESEDTIDVICREKMCDWSYRVCEHFHTNREIVSFSFSMLDRFVDLYCCDRTTFKLASMTTLYMATKLFSDKQMSMHSLAHLSKGEFDILHIAEMEFLILKSLHWRLNPPTVQSFIGRLHVLLQIEDRVLAKAIYQRAIFFAELCVYDYSLVTQDRCLVAVAALLNTLDGIEDASLSQKLQVDLLSSTQIELGDDFLMRPDVLEATQDRLWYLYSCSAQHKDDDDFLSLQVHTLSNKHGHSLSSKQKTSTNNEELNKSPVSIRNMSVT